MVGGISHLKTSECCYGGQNITRYSRTLTPQKYYIVLNNANINQ